MMFRFSTLKQRMRQRRVGLVNLDACAVLARPLVLLVCVLVYVVNTLSYSATGTTVSTLLPKRVAFIVQIFSQESAAMIDVQLKNFQQFVKDPSFSYHAVLANVPALREVTINDSRLATHVFVHRCPVVSLWECMDFTFQRVIPSLGNTTQLVVQLNVDMFLLRSWSAFAYMKSLEWPSISAVIEDHANSPPYLHPGLFIVDLAQIPNIPELSFGQVNRNGQHGDVGVKTADFLVENPHITVKPMVWSRHLDFTHLFQKGLLSSEAYHFITGYIKSANLTVTALAPDLYTHDFSWLHLRDLSCWSSNCEEKKLFLKNHLESFLERPGAVENYVAPEGISCWLCATTTTGHPPRTSGQLGFFAASMMSSEYEIIPTRELRILKTFPAVVSPSDAAAWMNKLNDETRRIELLVEDRRPQSRLPLPSKPMELRKNAHMRPLRYDQTAFENDTSYYWRYVYNGTELPQSEVKMCQKRQSQRYWAITYADGEQRRKIAHTHTKPSCLLHGVDEVRIFGPDDLDQEYAEKNKAILKEPRGKGLWIWKHYVQYKTLFEMSDGDIVLFIDSDFRCDPSITQYFCLAQHHDIVGFHHSHPDYTLERLASRDAMILMNLDTAEVASSVQSSGGNILYKKSETSVNFVRELAAWSQQIDVVSNHGKPSKYGVDWPGYIESSYNHQCDQAISSLMLVKHKVKTFPWHLEGYGAGSDDTLNRAQRTECGLSERAMTIHVKDDLSVSWIGEPDRRDEAQIACMGAIEQVLIDFAATDSSVSNEQYEAWMSTCVPNIQSDRLKLNLDHRAGSRKVGVLDAMNVALLNLPLLRANSCSILCLECSRNAKKLFFASATWNECGFKRMHFSQFTNWLRHTGESVDATVLHIQSNVMHALDALFASPSVAFFHYIQFKTEEVDEHRRYELRKKLSETHFMMFHSSWERWVLKRV